MNQPHISLCKWLFWRPSWIETPLLSYIRIYILTQNYSIHRKVQAYDYWTLHNQFSIYGNTWMPMTTIIYVAAILNLSFWHLKVCFNIKIHLIQLTLCKNNKFKCIINQPYIYLCKWPFWRPSWIETTFWLI